MDVNLTSHEYHQQDRQVQQLAGRIKGSPCQTKILVRIGRAERGNFGDSAPVGEGVNEMRIDYGPGYRIYYAREGEITYLLLCGGDKSSQQRDIDAAKELWKHLKNN